MTAEFPVAVHALVYLNHKGRLVSSAELAENICTNPARVRKIMSSLHRAGLILSEQGRSSGYTALPEGDKITLRQVLMALDGMAVGVTWRSGDVDRECLISSGMSAVMDEIYEELNDECMSRLEKITIGSINDRIFIK